MTYATKDSVEEKFWKYRTLRNKTTGRPALYAIRSRTEGKERFWTIQRIFPDGSDGGPLPWFDDIKGNKQAEQILDAVIANLTLFDY